LKRFYHISIIALLLLIGAYQSHAQIIHFSQYYSSPAILGPSFAGINGGTRAIFNYRDQWPGIGVQFRTFAFAMDHYLYKRNSGIGLSVMRDEAGSGNLSVTDVGLQYSYDLKLFGFSRNAVHFRPGLSFSFSQRGLDFYRLVFNDQLDFNGIANSTIENKPSINWYIDATASGLFYGEKWWFGFTGDHLLRPDQSMENYGDLEARLPMMVSVYGGYRFPLRDPRRNRRRDETLTVTGIYKYQAGFSQMDMGVYWTKDPFVLGAWYRGIPFLNNPAENFYTTDAVILLLGFKVLNMSIGYSYDITVSDLMPNSKGSHEVSIKYEFDMNVPRNQNRRRGAVSCPVF